MFSSPRLRFGRALGSLRYCLQVCRVVAVAFMPYALEILPNLRIQKSTSTPEKKPQAKKADRSEKKTTGTSQQIS